ncbi:MAG: PIG-L family deacetylase [Actinomycetota bacterium]|nr:PIG-L family deacetylase [Actinomycetota bacterium]
MPPDLYSQDRSHPAAQPMAVPERALTIGAHPDDAEFGAGGTLTRWASEGCRVSMLVITDGSKGTWEPDLQPGELVEVRKDEQRRAAEVLGAEEAIFLDRIDGELQPDPALREELCLWVRRLRPEVVLTHDPWRRYMLHPDHRAAGWAAIDAIVSARDHLFFPGQLGGEVTAHRPDWILLWSADEPDYWEDISLTLDRKVAALLCHSSQGASTMGGAHRDESRRVAFRERMAEWAADQGRPPGLPAAEAFKRIKP